LLFVFLIALSLSLSLSLSLFIYLSLIRNAKGSEELEFKVNKFQTLQTAIANEANNRVALIGASKEKDRKIPGNGPTSGHHGHSHHHHHGKYGCLSLFVCLTD
jgi:hypothetical protein